MFEFIICAGLVCTAREHTLGPMTREDCLELMMLAATANPKKVVRCVSKEGEFETIDPRWRAPRFIGIDEEGP